MDNKHHNLVFVVVDALRPDVMGIAEPSPITPHINRMGSNGFVFSNSYSTINTTDPSLSSIFSGRYPRFHGIINHGSKVTTEEKKEYIARVLRTLPMLLQQYGYHTMAVDWLGRWHRRGFQVYGDAAVSGKGVRRLLHEAGKRLVSLRLLSHRRGGKGLVTSPACDLVDYAIRLMQDSPRPFFLFIHFWDTHVPYYSPPEISQRLADAEIPWLRQLPDTETVEMLSGIQNTVWRYYLKAVCRGSRSTWDVVRKYLAAVNYADGEIGRLVRYLEESGLRKDTLLVLTSDHGESLGEHGIWFDHHGLYQPTVRVPLILSGPDFIPADSTSSTLVQHVDLLPTIVDLLGLDTGISSDGLSLAEHILRGEPFPREVAVVEEGHTQRAAALIANGHKLIKRIGDDREDAVCRYCHITHGEEEELYDLEEDPGESNNIVVRQGHLRDQMYALLERWSIDMEMKRMGSGA